MFFVPRHLLLPFPSERARDGVCARSGSEPGAGSRINTRRGDISSFFRPSRWQEQEKPWRRGHSPTCSRALYATRPVATLTRQVLGTCLNSFLLGVTLYQAGSYFVRYGHTDRLTYRLTVGILTLLDVFHSFISVYTICQSSPLPRTSSLTTREDYWCVENFDRPQVLLLSPWSFTIEPAITGSCPLAAPRPDLTYSHHDGHRPVLLRVARLPDRARPSLSPLHHPLPVGRPARTRLCVHAEDRGRRVKIFALQLLQLGRHDVALNLRTVRLCHQRLA